MTEEQSLQEFFNQQSLTTPETSSLTWVSEANSSISEDEYLRRNEKIISLADDAILERLEYNDGSLRIQDIISAKSEAFKQNSKILWLDKEDDRQLIPSQINIQIINN